MNDEGKVIDFKIFNIFIKATKTKLMEVINKYTFCYISEIKEQQLIFQNLKKSNHILISHYSLNDDDGIFIVGWKETIIIFKNSFLAKFKTIFDDNPNISIYFLSNTKEFFSKYLNVKNQQYECDKLLLEDISTICNEIIIKQTSGNSIYNNIGDAISFCITGYLILQSYNIINKRQRDIISCVNLDKNGKNSRIYNYDDFIVLREINSGSLSKIQLIYEIENGELLVLKQLNNENDSRFNKREYENYLNINYPLFPKIYGKVQDNGNLIIEFIQGKTLADIEDLHLKDNDKILILIQIMLAINYLHKNEFIYRDLKPSNIMIDQNKTIYIIDFDRMRKFSDLDNDTDQTKDFTLFAAPEVFLGRADYKSDIYSIGQMIYYIITEKNPTNINQISFENPQLLKIYKKCNCGKINIRPSIFELLFEFYFLSRSITKNSFINYFNEIQYINAIINLQDTCITKNIDDAIHYLTYLSDNNYSIASFKLSIIYRSKQYNLFDIEKAFYYLSLAANQNFPQAQYILSVFYFNGVFLEKDIDKSIYYLSLAANQNFPQAQYILGVLYLNGDFLEIDIDKAIYYLSLAAKNNHLDAQYRLGLSYFEFKNDIDKYIYYLTLAANQNHSQAQYDICSLYFEGKYVQQNINKAFKYLVQSASQNNQYAQCDLGFFYHEGICLQRDIKKAMHYYSLAAHQNNFFAQFQIGMIYAKGKYCQKDIKKATYYLELAANNDNYYNYIPQFNLGLIYDIGNDVSRDINIAIHFYTLSANQNFPDAQHNLALIYENDKFDIQKAMYYYSLAANQNHSWAKYNLALIYFNRKYVERNINKVIHYLKQAANLNHPKAQYSLGLLYHEGKYVEKDIKKAIYYYSLASKQNHFNSQIELGLIYLEGYYDVQDVSRAIYLFKLSANQNYDIGQYYLGLVYITDRYHRQDIDKAIHYFTLSADQNNSLAQYCLGSIYYDGFYTKQDISKAIHYFTLSADHNNSESQYFLAYIYSVNKIVKPNKNKAFHYLTLAANKGHAEAQYILGYSYLLGLYTNIDINKGVEYIIRSSENKCIMAHFIVGYLYHSGSYIEKDIKKSMKYYREASSNNDQYAKNNLGIIYKNGYGNEISQSIGTAISYFDEAIRRWEDKVSMYNLSHLYIYDYSSTDKIDESIKLLIKLSNSQFNIAKDLLCIALIKKYGSNIQKIKYELYAKLDQTLVQMLYKMIISKDLCNESSFNEYYMLHKGIDYLYDFMYFPMISSNIHIKTQKGSHKQKNITSSFYQGFDLNI